MSVGPRLSSRYLPYLTTTTRQENQQAPEIDLLKEQLQAVQAELKNLRDAVIPSMNKEIKTLTVDMAAVNGKLNHIDERFDDVLRRQEENARSQTSSSTNWTVMNSLMDTLSISKKTPAFSPQSPSQTTGTSYKSTDRAMLLRSDDEILRGPLTYTGHPPYFDLNDQDLMDQAAKIVLLSETHWSSGVAPKFKTHHILKKDRPNRMGGGFFPIHLNTPGTVEAIGASILCKDNQHIDFLSIYVPKADCETEDIEDLLNRTNPFRRGDFNGHHLLWEPNSIENKAGKSIHKALINDPNVTITPITTPNLGTRIDLASGKASTIDLTITSPTIAVSATVTPEPYMGSDHLPLIITLNARATRLINRPAAWKLNKDNWTQWNLNIEENLRQRNFTNITDPEDAIASFSECIETSNTRYLKKTNLNVNANVTKNPTRPWWNE
ncbi:LOW QUALITY PROTEIN: hypothetical protein DAPPUDRAFT_247860 [Daphnia pulex]|uniref:Endonuclease/exonuclease/phosphatase domain-containing protein n=1 Tax=Daphnia pulex TaxID=6669 RepID=E9GT06_DAPPU|nr:LOW QUALITY PROTEIN: hypothetical protein DAPPUDRAFT_247860 [Daphnia pulex]|eukprot:EFX77285.1 LOW QUALITY PROTEIN: hypothetical protein DAPPUDRAFT_247860 [Daphnia pulex]